MLQVKCDKCQKQFWVKGYTTPDGYTDPGEVVTELECQDDLANAYRTAKRFLWSMKSMKHLTMM